MSVEKVTERRQAARSMQQDGKSVPESLSLNILYGMFATPGRQAQVLKNI